MCFLARPGTQHSVTFFVFYRLIEEEEEEEEEEEDKEEDCYLGR
jgi:hypothetical protein